MWLLKCYFVFLRILKYEFREGGTIHLCIFVCLIQIVLGHLKVECPLLRWLLYSYPGTKVLLGSPLTPFYPLKLLQEACLGFLTTLMCSGQMHFFLIVFEPPLAEPKDLEDVEITMPTVL